MNMSQWPQWMADLWPTLHKNIIISLIWISSDKGSLFRSSIAFVFQNSFFILDCAKLNWIKINIHVGVGGHIHFPSEIYSDLEGPFYILNENCCLKSSKKKKKSIIIMFLIISHFTRSGFTHVLLAKRYWNVIIFWWDPLFATINK